MLAAGLTTGGLVGPAMAESKIHLEGEYAGVSPGVRPLAVREGRSKDKAPPKSTLLWIGFSARADEGADVWFQTAEPVTVDQSIDGQTLVVFFPGLRAQVQNTRRPIDTSYFDNPIARISARTVKASRARKGKPAQAAGVEVRISFKNPRDAAPGSLRTATEADGRAYTYLSFARGTVPTETVGTP